MDPFYFISASYLWNNIYAPSLQLWKVVLIVCIPIVCATWKASHVSWLQLWSLEVGEEMGGS